MCLNASLLPEPLASVFLAPPHAVPASPSRGLPLRRALQPGARRRPHCIFGYVFESGFDFSPTFHCPIEGKLSHSQKSRGGVNKYIHKYILFSCVPTIFMRCVLGPSNIFFETSGSSSQVSLEKKLRWFSSFNAKY